MAEQFELTINGRKYRVRPDLPAETSLNTFLREEAHLTGTKFMCREGGCGACIVAVKSVDPVTKQEKNYAVNSCLLPVRSCHGLTVTTVEDIGNKQKGYHPVQLYLAKFNGTQCGFCSPGMVMNMYSLLIDNPGVKMKEVENSFGGNLCRCTGYRPIMDAFKALASDATVELKRAVGDIEDLLPCNGVCKKNCNGHCTDEARRPHRSTLPFRATLKNGELWYRPYSLMDVWEIFKIIENRPYILLGGNTAQGVEKPEVSPIVYIDLGRIVELRDYKISDSHLDIGANMTLTDAMALFSKESAKPGFAYLKVLSDHIDLVANVPVRNIGTLAGNLAIKHKNNKFPSDIFLILETVGAQVVVARADRSQPPIPLQDLLAKNLYKALIKRIILPRLPNDIYKVRTFKIMPRSQNVHALINAGFRFKLDNSGTILEKPSIVFGGVNHRFIHAVKTEEYFKGKKLLNDKVLSKGLEILSDELEPDNDPLKPSQAYRRKAALLLLYKFVLGIDPKSISTKNASGGMNLERRLGTGRQDRGTKPADWPENKNFPKLEGVIQASGEAEYVNDLPPFPGQLHGALVLAREAIGDIQSIDPSEALAMEGVVAFYSATDIPGTNNFMISNAYTYETEEIFSSGKILYAGQPVGVVVAENYELVLSAARKVKITYKNKAKPILSVKDVLQRNANSRIKPFKVSSEEKQRKHKSANKISGELELGQQYHFTMEPQSCVCVPVEDGLDVFSATQWMQNVQGPISKCLNLPENSINIQVRRIGGGFGCKITRSALIATACALAAYKLNRPVRMVLDIQTNMEAIGKRAAAYSQYEIGFDDDGKIEEAKIKVYSDNGCALNDPYDVLILSGIQNCYRSSDWNIDIYDVKTDNPSSAWMRAPGTLEGMLTTEQIMEHIATTIGKDPLSVRLNNFGEFPQLASMVDTIKKSSEYDLRSKEILKFNKDNRWRKRGISLIPMVFHLDYFVSYHAMMSIYADDGTVSLTTGGIEMGQGLNTKVAQVCAYALGIPLDMVKVKPTNCLTAPNDGMSGASITSDTCCHSVLKCCEIMAQRLAPIKKKLKNPTWEELIYKAFEESVDLNVSYMNAATELQGNDVFGVGVSEVEVDLLTGKHVILRTDILEDAGESLSPYIDLGQIEGAFVMGLGYMLTERIVTDATTGMNLTNRTWHYWPPGAKDIPADFRVNIARDMPNASGVLRSKSTGEPPICLAYSVVCAIRQALKAAREEVGLDKEWFNLDQPCTVEKILMSAKTPFNHLVL
ncbi:indole-3-acetaldehyde oxidase-like [Cimex lectularius]|uniref:Indole-3-acetaldehyde oxidase n=1 Tax=Cimex lectularius TaxID=79782 RepID=A0A8I6RUK7_CIMLE|nr:indole-3-acetaldehyde oxidase-like [Cimex lectularius]